MIGGGGGGGGPSFLFAPLKLIFKWQVYKERIVEVLLMSFLVERVTFWYSIWEAFNVVAVQEAELPQHFLGQWLCPSLFHNFIPGNNPLILMDGPYVA